MIGEEAAAAAQKMQEYIEENLKSPITLSGLSKAAGYSPWHAARLFKEATGRAPFDYIRARRLTMAALQLRQGNPRVFDVALDFLFDTQEGFTRAFSKTFGVPPARYRRTRPAIRLFMPRGALDDRQSKMEMEGETMTDKTRTIFAQVIMRPERKLLLKRGIRAEEYFGYCGECGCDVFDTLAGVREALYEPVGMWLPESMIPRGTSRYVQGVELPMEYDKPVPEGFELTTLPPAAFMVFQGEPYDDADFMDEIGRVEQHIERFDPKLYGYEWAWEDAPRFQMEPLGARGYIEACPVKKIS